jgi:Ni,Fe-hydrogenase III large subunit/Ni,Fe-hydrogenase III component G
MSAQVALYNGQSVRLDKVSHVLSAEFREQVLSSVENGARISSLFARPVNGQFEMVAILADDRKGTLGVLRTIVDKTFQSLTTDCPEAGLFEREIAEQWGILPAGHPWLKPVRFHEPYCGNDVWQRDKGQMQPSVMDFYKVSGDEVHEVAVGPVHAGIIEPGHFRFQCHGEDVLSLEISLGYQHRGAERAMAAGPDKRTIHYAETVAGDTTIGHATAYCHLVESLSNCHIPPRAQSIRGIALELERLANHTGDLGALAGDIGYLPTASFCGRLRGDFLNLTAMICGNRFGRNLVRPGGVCFDIDPSMADALEAGLRRTYKDVAIAAELLWQKPSVTARFEATGELTYENCIELGLVGPAARACGLERDVRFDFPTGVYMFTQIPLSTWPTGDVFARAYVRWLEIQRSVDFILAQLQTLPKGSLKSDVHPMSPNSMSVSLVEGWRGEICHTAMTDDKGRFASYKIVDPSFHNWPGLAMAMRGQQISDFPLCNKSFNLSYCGHDL